MYVPCGEVGMVLDHGSSINGSRERVPLYHPLARPHAVPGVPDNTGFHLVLSGILHLRVRATTMRLALNEADVVALEW